MKNPIPSTLRRGRQTDDLGFTTTLLAVVGPAYESALADWRTETGQDPGEHFTVYQLGRARDIMRAANHPDEIPQNVGFLDALSRNPDLTAFVLRRFVRLRETGDPKGKPGKVCATGVFKLLASANPHLSPMDLAELARKTRYAENCEQVRRRPDGKPNNILAAQALKTVRDANHARLAVIKKASAEAEAAKQAEREALAPAAARRLKTYTRKMEALFAKHLPGNAAQLKVEGTALREEYADVERFAQL
jgi:hypothetical protein